jgi:triacylglycerol lipase
MTLAEFDAQASAYSATNALFLGEAAQAAYQPGSGMIAWAVGAGFEECVPFAAPSGGVIKANIEGFVALSAETLLVCFRGTDPTAGDWMLDLQTRPERGNPIPGAVHHGFHHALLAVWPQVRPHLDARGPRRVWIAGHSLGGALAVACAARALFEDPQRPIGIRGIYTFGQPRYGDHENAHACAQRLASVLFRHVNDRDIVPRVPPYLPGFRHWGTEILFDSDGNAHVNAQPVETEHNIIWRFLENPPDLEIDRLRHWKENAFEVATDHFMEKAYLPQLRRAAGRTES